MSESTEHGKKILYILSRYYLAIVAIIIVQVAIVLFVFLNLQTISTNHRNHKRFLDYDLWLSGIDQCEVSNS